MNLLLFVCRGGYHKTKNTGKHVNHGEHDKDPPEFSLLISEQGPPMAIPAVVALVHHNLGCLSLTTTVVSLHARTMIIIILSPEIR